ncbi:UNVERIFIED_ORG: hypothetical protein M2442_004226 [Methylorubrum zatmanii]|nr:hypothetical protein [Methylorubrum zatmanii]
MKNTRTTLAPVNTSSRVDIEAPITAAKAQNIIRADEADMRSIRNENTKMKASGASISTHLKGLV